MALAVVGLLATAMAVPAAAADPAGTTKLNAVRSEQPRITVLGASASGVLYKVSRVGEESFEPAWLKPTGAAAYQVPGFAVLSGDKIYGGTKYQVIGDPVTRSCPGLPGPAEGFGYEMDSTGFLGYTPFGWLTDDGQKVNASASGCTLSGTAVERSLAQKLAAADSTGYVTVTIDPVDPGNTSVEYRTYANPAQPVLLNTGRQGVRYNTIAVAGGSVSWAVVDFDWNSGIFQASTGVADSGHLVGTVTGDVVRTSTAGTSVSWDKCSSSDADNCTSGSFTTTGVASSLAGTRSVASNGTKFVFDRASSPGVQAGIDKAAAVSSAVPHTLIQVVQKQTPLSGGIAIAQNRVLYSDGRGRDTLYQRDYASRPGSVLLGSENTVAQVASSMRVETEGAATAYTDAAGSVRLIKPNGQVKNVFEATFHGFRAADADDRYAPFSVSGRWVLWTKEQYYGTSCPSEGCTENWGTIAPMLTDTVAGTTEELESASVVAGGKLYSRSADGILSRDLSTGVEAVVAPGVTADWLAADTQYVVWRGTTAGVTTVGYKNLVTGQLVQGIPADLYDFGLKVSGGRIAYQAKVGSQPDATTLTVLDLATRTKRTFGESAYRFDLAPQAVAWIGADQTARIATLR